ncbi:RND family efflux transporter [Luminiphilus syltensis NOR5-1B]|uniref:RND family efflux transporter n=1 Tax=Luminiphilus syltensis NOR5-1B TaxID=565045 RepID=B8KTR5_9GAMM|nr:efflux RND transporter permease subunit [Luminiphilus syltensis]EED36521.1 RND family efflux transporter [Luminiphilus syltensis NOR5-1B]
MADHLGKRLVGGLPELGVRRPWLTAVMNLLIAVAGIAALLAIEVRELPDVDRPIVNVRTTLPGASPETMDAEVTRILEGAVARVSGATEISSSSEENNSRVRVEFGPGSDVDRAAADVREAVSRVAQDLPENVEQISVFKADEDAEEIVRIAIRSDIYGEEKLARIVDKDIVPAFISLPGVADVPTFGARDRILRIILDPLRMTSYGLTVADLAEVLRRAPLDVPAGSFRSGDQQLLVRANAKVTSEEDIAALQIRDEVRVGDIARVAFTPADPENIVRFNGERVVGIGVVRQAGSNTIEISDGVNRAIAALNQRLEGVELIKISDDALFIRGAVAEVIKTLAVSILVVIATIRLFTGSMLLTLIPALAIPVSLLGTLAISWILGFSINILTLLALVLATGLIVDDAIVVLESIQRRRAEGSGSSAAAVVGTHQVFFAVIATTAVLVAVFIPIAFLPGTAGRLFREFGLVLSAAVAISSFVALSLVPAAMSRLAFQTPRKRRLGAVGNKLTSFYRRSLQRILNRPAITLLACIAAAGGSGALYQQLDQELLPPEDRGFIGIWGRGPNGVGLSYVERQSDRIENILVPLIENGEIESLYTVVGRWDPNIIYMNAQLAPWNQRDRSQQAIAAELNPLLSGLPGMNMGVFGGNSLNLRGASGGGVSLALLGSDYGEMFAAARDFTEKIRENSETVTRPRISYQPSQPQLSVNIDRQRAADLDIALDDLAQTLRVMVDGLRIVDLNADDQAISVFLEAGSNAIKGPDDLINLYVRSNNGALIPLSSIVTLEERGVADQLDRRLQRRTIEIDASVIPGVALQSAIDELFAIAEGVLPGDITMVTLGEAAELDRTNRDTLITFCFALFIVFLVLVAQFESLTSALVIMLIVPFGIAAAVVALFITDTSLNIYSQVGLVMLIGLIAKNGILLVEFADQERDAGASVKAAIIEAATLRSRPIVMTMISTVLGALPLVLASGPGSEARMAVGWVVFGGLGLATVFTLYLTPVIYLWIAPLSKPRATSGRALDEELAAFAKTPLTSSQRDALDTQQL